ncbi:LPS export ABC transporter periplasmic protein LptC [Atribacter laminatus]|jgi:lipopolysaccharide export system protein LptA|nr:LPS export ABC transporter periplasmic protein LptC [Atribacter laminatus]
MSNDWKTLLWLYLSLVLLVILILVFWINPLERSKTFRTALISPTPINQGSLVIQLEKAEISRVSDSGKEWEIHTDDLSKDGENIYLNGVQGFLFQENQPQYQIKAKKGQVDVENSDARLEDINLVKIDGGGSIVGKTLTWLSNEQFMRIENVLVEKKNMLIESKKLWYDLSRGLLAFPEEVVITLKSEGNL